MLRAGGSQKDPGRAHATALRQGTFSFMALARQSEKFILVMARFRVRKKNFFFFFFRLNQKISPIFYLSFLNLMLSVHIVRE